LKRLGIQLAIDDFGTGYSSLSYLSRFPVDMLKVDRSFVEKIATDSQSAELVQTIVQLGGSLGLHMVADGIENAEQLAALRRIGCRFGQGFLFSKPVSHRLITAMIRGGLPCLGEAEPVLMAMAGDVGFRHG